MHRVPFKDEQTAMNASTAAEQQLAKFDTQLFSLGCKRKSLRLVLERADSS
jgi:hypothetical protein